MGQLASPVASIVPINSSTAKVSSSSKHYHTMNETMFYNPSIITDVTHNIESKGDWDSDHEQSDGVLQFEPHASRYKLTTYQYVLNSSDKVEREVRILNYETNIETS